VELEKLSAPRITCRITKLDVTDEDVVVDRRVVSRRAARGLTQARREAMKEGDTVTGTVRSLMPYGAFVDLGGIDGLLHISDIAHSRVSKPEDVLTVGQELQVKILKIDLKPKRFPSASSKLQAEPWQTPRPPSRRPAHHRTVTRLADFGHSSRSNPASKASFTSLKCRGARRFATPATFSSRATALTP